MCINTPSSQPRAAGYSVVVHTRFCYKLRRTAYSVLLHTPFYRSCILSAPFSLLSTHLPPLLTSHRLDCRFLRAVSGVAALITALMVLSETHPTLRAAHGERSVCACATSVCRRVDACVVGLPQRSSACVSAITVCSHHRRATVARVCVHTFASHVCMCVGFTF
jgi:hypothetical protein